MPQVFSLRQRYKSLLENMMDFFEYSGKLLNEHLTQIIDSRLKLEDIREITIDGFKVAKGFTLRPVEGQ